MDYVLAVDLGGTKIYTALVGPGDVIIKRDLRPTEAALGKERVISNILESIKNVSEAVAPGERIFCLGVGVPGCLEPSSGVVKFAPNLKWRNVNLKEILEKEVQLPVFLENDGNLAALGEMLYGSGSGHNDLVFITVSTGVGGGLILNGEIYTGAAGAAGEIGHIVVAPDGPLCSCGNRGCLEAVSSGSALKKQAQDLIAEGKCRKILELAGGNQEAVEVPLITKAAHYGDLEALKLLAEAGRYLGLAIGMIFTLLNPGIFVIGGGVARGAGELLLEPARKEAVKHIFPPVKNQLKIVPGGLRGRGGVLGTAAFAHRKAASLK